MSIFTKYQPQSPTKFTTERKPGKSLNERLAENYDRQAQLLKGKKVKNKAGNTVKPMFRHVGGIIRCTPTVSNTAPLLGRDSDKKPKCVELESDTVAARFFTDLAKAIRAGDKDVIAAVEKARKEASKKRK